MLVVAYRKEQVKDVVSLFGIVPDFIMILLLQLIVMAVYKATGLHVARVATITQDDPALPLPLLILTLIPTVFVLRSISNRTYITEYLFNIRGITRLVFSYSRAGGYQFNLVVTAFLAILVPYGLLFAVLRLIIRLAESEGDRG